MRDRATRASVPRVHVLALTVVSWLAAEPAPACPTELFRIERSKNANVVLYESTQRADGSLDADEPVRASWLMLAEQGQREKLTLMERKFAYGFDVRANAEGPGVLLHLKALKRRVVHVVLADSGCPAARTTIGGETGVLQRIFVKTTERLVPKVEYIELFGVHAATGSALYERLLRGQE